MPPSDHLAYRSYSCPTCGAPVPPPRAVGQVIRCAYCLVELRAEARGFACVDEEDEPLRDPELARLWIGGQRYAVHGLIGRGDSADVFLARRDARPTELVVLKCLRAAADRDRLEHEAAVVRALSASEVEGAAHFCRLVPQAVSCGVARLGLTGTEGERFVALYRFQSGFVHTFEDVRAVYPGGVAPEAAVWLWKRVLETLDFVHKNGWVHGAVLPRHLLVNARDHGVHLVGYTCAAEEGRALPALAEEARAFYPEGVLERATAAGDVAMSARSILYAIGGNAGAGKAPGDFPEALGRLIEARARPDGAGAWATRQALDEVARALFGRPTYVPFAMPGWRIDGD